ncbi:hypothetical protein ACQUW5_08570 [Legionella sp. CNM-1927-20]|uniref:hypothetical protein n=1 Tax=Legionella sp. CNM-1927-20 TaxID=3422221 RepID=UPI00403AEC13
MPTRESENVPAATAESDHVIKLRRLLQRFDLSEDERKEALSLVNKLTEEEIKKTNRAGNHLVDIAIIESHVEIANAIISRYARLIKDSTIRPLEIDFNRGDTFLPRSISLTLAKAH